MEAGIIIGGLLAGLCALAALTLTLVKPGKLSGAILAASALFAGLLTLLAAWWGYRQEITSLQETLDSTLLTDSLFTQMYAIAGAGSLLGLALMITMAPMLLGFFSLAFGLTIPADDKTVTTSRALTVLGASSALLGVGLFCVSFLTYIQADAFVLALIRWWT